MTKCLETIKNLEAEKQRARPNFLGNEQNMGGSACEIKILRCDAMRKTEGSLRVQMQIELLDRWTRKSSSQGRGGTEGGG